jgi:hypothetical protein
MFASGVQRLSGEFIYATIEQNRKHIFLLTNSMQIRDDNAITISMEFFNTIILAGMLPHRLALKVSILIILLRNLNAASRLCNGTCLIIWHLTQRLIITQIIGCAHAWNIVNILRITTTTNYSKLPFTLQRC